MAGTDAAKGFTYQHGQAVLRIIELAQEPSHTAVRVEGRDDVVDLEIVDKSGSIAYACQCKVRAERAWGRADLLTVLQRWSAVDDSKDAQFEFITDGTLGPSAKQLVQSLAGSEPLDRELADLDHIRSRVRVVTDTASAETLLVQATDAIEQITPDSGAAVDIRERARNRALELFHLVSDRSGRRNPDDRLVSRREVCDLLGVDPSSPRQTWAQIKEQLVDRLTVSDLIEVKLVSHPGEYAQVVDAIEICAEPSKVSILSGPAGSGKTKALELVTQTAAGTRRPVVVVMAELYLPGRLSATVSYALQRTLDTPVGLMVSRQLLEDPTATLVIDGLSEIDPATRRDIADDLRHHLSVPDGAKIVLCGRDYRVLAAALPRAIEYTAFETCEWNLDQQKALVAQILGNNDTPKDIGQIVAMISRDLGDASRNPFILNEAAVLVGNGVSVYSRADVYARLIERRTEQHAELSPSVLEVVLGHVFALLLQQGQRYCDAYVWTTLCTNVAENIRSVDASTVDRISKEAGLVRSEGPRGVVVPLHDSVADYLAARAYQRAALEFPDSLSSADVGWLSFAAELGYFNGQLLSLAIRYAPWSCVSIADRDRTPLGANTASEVQAAAIILRIFDHHENIAIEEIEGQPWLEVKGARIGPNLLDSGPLYALAETPLRAIVSLWRYRLRLSLYPPRRRVWSRPRNGLELVKEIEKHLLSLRDVQERLVRDLIPWAEQDEIIAELSECWRREVLVEYSPEAPLESRIWSRNAASLTVCETREYDALTPYGQRGAASALLEHEVESYACENVRTVINGRCKHGWL